MTTLQLHLAPRSPFVGCMDTKAKGRDVTFSDRTGLAMTTILARKAQGSALAARIHEHFNIDLPHGPRRAESGILAFAGTGPGTWFATSEQGGNALFALLREKIGDLASVSDQSDGYAIVRLSGLKVRQALRKLVPVDVHPRAFQVNDVAVTVAAHIGVTLWRLKDRSDGAAVFEIAAFRSLAGSLWHALSTSAAEFGYGIEAPVGELGR